MLGPDASVVPGRHTVPIAGIEHRCSIGGAYSTEKPTNPDTGPRHMSSRVAVLTTEPTSEVFTPNQTTSVRTGIHRFHVE